MAGLFIKNDPEEDGPENVMNEIYQLECPHCEYTSSFDELKSSKRKAQQLLNAHMNRTHEEFKQTCGECAEKFWTEERLRIHIRERHNKDGVNAGFQMKNDPEDEDDEDSNEKTILVCPHCDYSYTFDPKFSSSKRKASQYLNAHLHRLHGDQKLNCDECGKAFWTKEQLKVHILKHQEKVVVKMKLQRTPKKSKNVKMEPEGDTSENPKNLKLNCDECNKIFPTEHHLRSHKMEHWRNGEEQYSCDQCDYKCKLKKTLKVHYNIHLGIKHLCHLCPASYPSATGLKQHLFTHSGDKKEKNFACKFCERRFVSNSELSRHIRSHTGEKPFTCDTCGKSFTTNSSMEKHKTLHDIDDTGNIRKKYVCEICNMRFTRKSYLTFHLNAHKEDNVGKRVKYTNEFKLNAIERSKEVGLVKACEEMRIPRNSLRNWIALTIRPHACDFCDVAFPCKSALMAHVERNHPQEVKEEGEKLNHSLSSNLVQFRNHEETSEEFQEGMRLERLKKANGNGSSRFFSREFKKEVAAFAKEHTIQAAKAKYNLGHTTIWQWVKLMNNPSTCHLCGKEFPDNCAVRRHLKQVQHNPDGSAMSTPVISMNDKPFAKFLAENSMLPSEEEIKAIEEEEIRREKEQKELAEKVREMVNEERELARLEQLKKDAEAAIKEDLASKASDDLNSSPPPKKETGNKKESVIDQIQKYEIPLEFNCFYCNTTYEEKTEMMKHIAEYHPGCEIKFRRITVEKENPSLDLKNVITDDSSSNYDHEINDISMQDDDANFDYDSNSDHEMKPADSKAKFLEDEPYFNFEDSTIPDQEMKIEDFKVENDQEEVFDCKNVEIKTEVPDDQEVPSVNDDDLTVNKTNHGDIKDDLIKIHFSQDDESNLVLKENLEVKIASKIKKTKKKKDGPKKDKTRISCSYCGKTFKSAKFAKKHEKVVHLGESVKNCEFCGTQLSEGIYLKEHQLRKHAKELEERTGIPIEKFHCDRCDKVYNVKRDLDDHIQVSHLGKKRRTAKLCTDCGRYFTRLDSYRYHQASAHGRGELKNYQCPKCPNVYHKKGHLDRHVKAIHEKEKVPCDICGKMLSDRNVLRRHLLTHGEPKFQCDECPEKFREACLLRDHKMIHAGIPISCQYCGKQFSSTKTLKNHESMFHSGIDGEVCVCNECGREFKTPTLLKIHMRSHSSSGMKTCLECGKEYKEARELKNHINAVHLGQKNFPCDICGKVFSRDNVLRTHKKIHFGIKQFNCLYCNSAYGEKRNLMNHIAKNHPGCELKYKRITPDGEAILDEKTTLRNTPLL